jgi:hypothetical protein
MALFLSALFLLSVPSQMFAQHSSRSVNTKKTTRVDNDSAKYKARRANAFKRAPQQVNPLGETVGTPVEGAKGVQESVAQIMARQQALGNAPPVERAMPEREGPDRSTLPQAPGAPAVASWPISAEAKGNPVVNGSSGIVPAAPQTTGTSFTGATLADTGAFPPDTMGAVGPTQFVVFVNGRVRTFNKTTGTADGVINADSDVFFASVMSPFPAGGLNFTSDPNVRFDRLSQRWFLTIIDVPSSTSSSIGDIPNRILIAVSDAASAGVLTPATVWTYYFVQQDLVGLGSSSGEFLDYPSLGIDNNALYIGGNMFGAVSGSFTGVNDYVIRKSSVLSGGPVVTTAFRGLTDGTVQGAYAPRGVDNYDPAATEGYFIGVSIINFSQLVMRRVSTPGGTPTLSADLVITVPTTGNPRTVTHLGNTGGTNGNLDPLDDRLFAAHIRNGRLWTAHNIAVDTAGVASGGAQRRNATRWYELIVPVGAGTPTVNQSGTVFDNAATVAAARQYWIPSAMVSGQGHAAFGYSTAGTPFRIDAATNGRLSGDTLGTSGAVNIYTASSTAYNPPSDPGPPRRWGDYSYTSLDPQDDMTMWTIQEFCNATNTYGVRAVKLIAPPPATPAQVNTAGTVTPTTVPSTRSVFFVDIAGTQVSGSGFYDPGADIAGATPFTHISATVTADVGVVGTPPTVNSATYINPTTVRLSLNTTTATPNLPAQKYTVNITNPDGQTTSGSQILQVVLPPTAANGIISGQVTTPDGAPLSGTVISLSGTQSARTITDSNGNYRFDNVETNGFYTVKPSRANYTFGPSERSFSALSDKTDAVFTANPLPAQVANPLDTDLYFVRQQYLDFLGRDPDPQGLAYWTSELDKCGTDATCLNDRRIGISAAFFMEDEYQKTGSFIYRLYKGALDRQVSYNEFSADRQHVVGGPALEQSKVNFAEQFVQRAEFAQKYQNKNTAESFVDALLSNVKQASGADLSGQRGALIASYNAGTTQSQSRSLALRDLIEQPDFKQSVYNSSFVLMEYFGYLKRDPDTDGFKFWLNVLNDKEPNNYRGMVCSFITSTEYQSRFSSFISHSNRECGK